ncbi:related to Mitochondrial import inner membrane translocase subunit TIM21 [Cephalotrichum gorgonifer]|uniref:Mitochondrial import inner membrane translocase subunit Tim21 n=1 Tax=Cephalotrichum gorgonifer TaxID=2041049 RepID=A0AAE8MR89_9PEZI|nr:related to Mitochondrial import inner membrane translocase subunit TIM21 [Cephalotrichum gorgonifer]
MKLARPSVPVKTPANLILTLSTRTSPLRPALLHVLLQRRYATETSLGKTSSPKPRRRSVTPFNDDGRVAWSDLSAGEKTARATQQSFNFGLILAGLGLTGVVTYLLFTEVFAPDSKVANFSRAVDLIKKDPVCQSLLGDPKKIMAHGEETYNKWRRARPIASTIYQDRYGVEHLMMKFHVDGPLNKGLAQLHMTRHPKQGDGDFEYKYLFVDVRGHHRVYLKNADEEKKAAGAAAKKKTRFLGINFG